MTIGGGVIADLFHADRRGLATAVYSLGPLFGPVIGPVCGGFIAQRIGWRWVFWILLISGTAISIAIELFNRETNHRVLIHRKVKRKFTSNSLENKPRRLGSNGSLSYRVKLQPSFHPAF